MLVILQRCVSAIKMGRIPKVEKQKALENEKKHSKLPSVSSVDAEVAADDEKQSDESMSAEKENTILDERGKAAVHSSNSTAGKRRIDFSSTASNIVGLLRYVACEWSVNSFTCLQLHK